MCLLTSGLLLSARPSFARLRHVTTIFGDLPTVDPTILVKVKTNVLQRIQAGEIEPKNLSEALNEAYRNLAMSESDGLLETQSEPAAARPGTIAIDWKKSLSRHAVICLECGESFKQLSRKHLSLHDLDPKSYRLRYNIPSTQALVAKETTVRRRRVANWVKPWEKTTKSMRAKGKAKA